jgi:hypothetical protein
MHSNRMVVVVVAALVAAVCSVTGALAAPAAPALTCTTSWSNPSASGSFTAPGNWSNGAPSSGVDACLPAGNYTVTVPAGSSAVGTLQVGSSGAAQQPTLELSASHAGGNVTLAAGGAVDNFGTIELTDPDPSGSPSASAELELSSGTLTNDGTIETLGSAGVSGIDGNLTNDSDGTLDVGQNTQIEAAESDTFTTDGTVTISSGDALLVGCPAGGGCEASTLQIGGGTITNAGTFQQGINLAGAAAGGGTLTVTGGALSGNALLDVGVAASFSGSGSGSFTFEGSGSLAGTIAAGDTVAIAATSSAQANWTATSGLTNDGTLDLTGGSATGAPASSLVISSGETLTNTGTIVAEAGAGGRLGLDGNVTNQTGGTIDVDATLEVGAAQTSTLQTSGTIDIATGADLLVGCGATTCQASTLTINGGTITDSGSLRHAIAADGASNGGGALNLNGGTITGNPLLEGVAPWT